MPEEELREYYGEKIALYFAFMSSYTRELVLIGIFGVGIFVIQQLADQGSVIYVIAGILFGMIKNVWSSYFLYGWRRREFILSSQWGQLSKKSN